MYQPIQSFHAVTQKAAAELGDAIPAIGLSAALMHVAFHFVTEHAGESNSLFLRIVALVALLPTIFHNFFTRKSHRALVSDLAILGLFICGPLFFSLSIVLELGQPEPNQSVIIHRQFEYFASFALILFFLSELIVVATAGLLCGGIAYLYALIFLNIERSDFLEIFAPVSSLWIFLLLLVSYVARKRADARLDGMAAISVVGSNIAHELRTPLASIKNFAKSIEKQMSNPNYAIHSRELTRRISREVDSANTIIDMLLISARSLDQATQHSDNFQVSEAITRAIQDFPYNNEGERRTVLLIGDENFQVTGPQLQITHVFFNLIKNGIKYSQSKGAAAKLSIHLDRKSKTITFVDNGVGISKANVKRIFDRFYTTEKYGQGTGIGLSFCKMTMESIGGSIDCESVLSEYTKFTLKFP